MWVDLPGKSYHYADGSTIPPPTIPPGIGEDLHQISLGLRIAAGIMMGLIFIFSIGFMGWTYYHRTTHIVRASQPFFLYIICIGTFIMGSAIIPISIDDGIVSVEGCDIACMFSPWLVTYGFVIAFSALFSKTWRINQIFHHPQLRRVTVNIKDVIVPFLILLGLNTIVLICWTAISPLKWERVHTDARDDFGRPLDSTGRCTVENNKSLPFVVLLLIINMAVLLLANIQAYQARTITVEFSESKYIGIINASILQAGIIGGPLLVIAGSEPSAFVLTAVGGIFVICMSMLLLIFIPKMKYLQEWKKKRFSSRSGSNVSGIKVLNNPRGDDYELRQLKFQIEASKVEKSETSRKMELLRQALASRGIEMDDLLETTEVTLLPNENESFQDNRVSFSHFG